MKPVHVDGFLYVLIAVSGAMVITFSDNDMYKYIPVWLMVYGKMLAGWTLAGATALKTYRSTTYGQSMQDKVGTIGTIGPDNSGKPTVKLNEVDKLGPIDEVPPNASSINP